MNDSEKAKASRRPWSRPSLKRNQPIRAAGAFYRTAEGKSNELGGVPLVTAEHAVTAAVRMAYKVAAAQVDRSSRLAQRLRDAGDRAVGPGSDRQALDATERLVFRAMMGGLTWLETAAAERDSPLKRLLAAEYRMLGALLGLVPTDGSSPSGNAASDEGSKQGNRARAEDEYAAASAQAARLLKIEHKKGPPFRPVRLGATDLAAVPTSRTNLLFYSVARIRSRPLTAELVVRGKRDATLILDPIGTAGTGRWRAAICDESRLQLGFIEIIL
jgi:hypothetical protein